MIEKSHYSLNYKVIVLSHASAIKFDRKNGEGELKFLTWYISPFADLSQIY